MLLSLDPSSTAIGFALSRSAKQLIDAGVVRPDDGDAPYLLRVDDMLGQLEGVIYAAISQGCTRAIVEMPGKHQSRGKGGKKRSSGASLMFYGAACGAVRQLCRQLFREGNRVESVGSDGWSRSSKAERQLAVMAAFKEYKPASDKGMDCSDAIALGQWWWERAALLSQGVA